MRKHSGCSGLESGTFAGPERRAWNRNSMWSFTNPEWKTSNAKFIGDNCSPHNGRMDVKRSQEVNPEENSEHLQQSPIK